MRYPLFTRQLIHGFASHAVAPRANIEPNSGFGRRLYNRVPAAFPVHPIAQSGIAPASEPASVLPGATTARQNLQRCL